MYFIFTFADEVGYFLLIKFIERKLRNKVINSVPLNLATCKITLNVSMWVPTRMNPLRLDFYKPSSKNHIFACSIYTI